MNHRTLGATGVSVSPLCLGAMMFGAHYEPDHEVGIRVIRSALDRGVNVIDTADAYSHGESEIIVGKAIAGRRDDVVLATKLHLPMSDDPNMRGNSRRWIVRACEASLRRLGVDHVDLLQLHRPDPATTLDDTLAALSDLVRGGKVRYVGSSTFPPSTIVEAQWLAESRRLERIRCEQPPYSMLVRGIEGEVLPTCRRYGMGVISWGPLAGGWLSGRWRAGATQMTSTRTWLLPRRYDLSIPDNRRKLDAVEQLSRLADECGLTLIHLSLAFVLAHPAISAAIIGPRTMEHLDSYLGAADVVLDDDVLDRIDAIVAPGTNVSSVDVGWRPPWLDDRSAR
ncbi:MAG: aldo/keto reductase [Microbacteriaceae bacterium]